jgi:HK97 family phage portal protein
MDLFSKILGREETKQVGSPSMTCLFDSSEHAVINYSEKANRAETVDYRGIGMTRYSSGLPPVALYTSSIAAVQAFPVVYGCVTAISEAIASLGIKVYQLDGGQKVEALDHPFYQLFSTPNPFQGSFEFLEELQQNLDVMGNNFIAIEKGPGTVSGLELYNLDPKYVSIIPDPKKKIKEYHYYINGNLVKYKPEEIIHIKYSNIDDPYYGFPPLTAAADVLTFETARLAYANKFFINGAIPTGVLQTDSNLGDSLLKKLRREWYNIHQGVNNSHNVAILQGGLKYNSIASPIKDLDFKGLKDLTKEDILTIFKVPSSVLGDQENTGGTEGKDALTAFWRGSIVPRLKRIESSINRGLSIQLFGTGTFVFEFNLKQVEALQEDKVAQATYLQDMVASSVMTPNEARMVLGLPLSTDQYADQLMVSNSFFGNQLMPADQASAAASMGGAGTTAAKPSAKPAPAKPAPAKPATAKPVTSKPKPVK